jgi:hypothetical protein
MRCHLWPDKPLDLTRTQMCYFGAKCAEPAHLYEAEITFQVDTSDGVAVQVRFLQPGDLPPGSLKGDVLRAGTWIWLAEGNETVGRMVVTEGEAP